ncbi:hypothetical protein [Chryseobacterium sp.]|uniref:hypothetical protein n=1 Tax=Chryseobacterium sp. TaxID=1871047 RepID=UPI00289AD75D|nr:hypothetical protein [Chryseobacterium sp.]
MTTEFFPPSEDELKDIIKGLKARLEDDSFQEEWVKIHEELLFREQQLKDLTIQKETI